VSYSRRKIGGTEHNLDVVLPELERRGHALQFLYFHDKPLDRAPIRTGPATELVDVSRLGHRAALARLRAFHPHLINGHGDIDAEFQASLLPIAAAAYSVHNYYGTCISGLKTYQLPVIQPCHEILGPACLLRYFPRRCGGLSPITMLWRYFTERRRLQVMSRYDAVITHSHHMETEYTRHGLHPARVYGLPYEASVHAAKVRTASPAPLNDRACLLFAGRMEKLKGGQTLIAALPEVFSVLNRPIELQMAGDGPDRKTWERMARRVMARHSGIDIQFRGWVTQPAMEVLFQQSHLLVMPSLCPEAFGKIGPEAAAWGLPAAAFTVGGIEEWLIPGVNGMAAPGDPPTARGLAGAIVQCLADPHVHAQLCAGALAGAPRFGLGNHVDALLALFAYICRNHPLFLALAAGQ
jgi:glycosyltransferase involved in cell wall biosynthesis